MTVGIVMMMIAPTNARFRRSTDLGIAHRIGERVASEGPRRQSDALSLAVGPTNPYGVRIRSQPANKNDPRQAGVILICGE